MVGADLLQILLALEEDFECCDELLHVQAQILIGLAGEYGQVLLGSFQLGQVLLVALLQHLGDCLEEFVLPQLGDQFGPGILEDFLTFFVHGNSG